MSKFAIGMYVRCPFDNEVPQLPRTFILGQVIAIDDVLSKVTVKLHATDVMHQFFGIPADMVFDEGKLSRCKIADDTMIVYVPNGRKARLITPAKSKDAGAGLLKYYILQNNKVKEAEEKDIIAYMNFADYNPVQQFGRYELHNPQWYLSRTIVSESHNAVKAAPFGFKTLLGSRAYLLPHQVDTIIRALNAPECRFMLADEVGLGKTIEACTIIKGLQYNREDLRVLIIVPDTLIYQWQTELSYKFWIDAPIIGKDQVGNAKIVLVSHEHYEKVPLASGNWDLCLVDETHRLLSKPVLYYKILSLSKQIESILLLSATPITNMQKEYQKLLTLLNPGRYGEMSEEDFGLLLSRQKQIRNLVFDRMTELDDYVKYDLSADYIDTFNSISEMVNDNKLKELIAMIDHKSEDKGLEAAKTILAYLSEFYQIDQCIIRHRRKELQEYVVKRNHELLTYQMQGAESNYFEREVYDGVIRLLSSMKQNSGNVEFVKKLLCAALSSPSAVKAVLTEYQSIASAFDLSTISEYSQRWEKAIIFGLEGQSNKFSSLISCIHKNNLANSKTIIFTAYSATAVLIEKILASKFGDTSVVSFHLGKDRDAVQEAADIFQNEDACKFIVCDESGGEGRNFQIAERIIHFDLPLSPFQIEQRIGRLDRIGRQEGLDVKSVILCSEDTVETDIFNIWHEGLNVFCESLCGMEIAFERIQSEVEGALQADVVFGLSKIVGVIKESLEEMRSEVEKERYFDIARQLDPSKQEIYTKLIHKFTENDGEKVIDTMLAWAKMVGFLGIRPDRTLCDDKVVAVDLNTRDNFNITCAKNAMYFPRRMDDIIKRAKKKNAILGTFSREVALRHENLAFFAPGNIMYDDIINNAIECYKGRSSAILYYSPSCQWKGFKLVYNVKFDTELLCRYQQHPRLMAVINQYIKTNQITLYYGYESEDEFEDATVIQEIERLLSSGKKGKHLGERDVYIDRETGKQQRRVMAFIARHPQEEWQTKIASVSKKGRTAALSAAQGCVMSGYGFAQIDNAYHAGKARKIFFDEKKSVSGLDKQAAKILQHLVKNPSVELDSIAFIELVKRAEVPNND